MKNYKIKMLLLLSIIISPLMASAGCGTKSTEGKLISKEISSINGTANFEGYFRCGDSMQFINQTVFSLPSGWSITQNNSLDTTSVFVEGDSIGNDYTISYPTTSLPYFAQEIKIVQYYKDYQTGDTSTSTIHFWVFFTPWNTVEIWDHYDYYTIGRVWKSPTDSVDTTRIFIAKSSLPNNTYDENDSNLTSEWQHNYEMNGLEGLPFYIKQAAIHPDTMAYFATYYGDDSTYQDPYDTSNLAPSNLRPWC